MTGKTSLPFWMCCCGRLEGGNKKGRVLEDPAYGATCVGKSSLGYSFGPSGRVGSGVGVGVPPPDEVPRNENVIFSVPRTTPLLHEVSTVRVYSWVPDSYVKSLEKPPPLLVVRVRMVSSPFVRMSLNRWFGSGSVTVISRVFVVPMVPE